MAKEHQVDTNYLSYLNASGLKGAKIGFSRDAIEPQPPLIIPDPAVVAAANRTVSDMIAHGALIQDLNLVLQVGLFVSSSLLFFFSKM